MQIKKGKHRPAWWWLQWPLFFKKKEIRKVVSFSFNCKYDLKGEDQQDTNKLFGIGYFPNHHKESARFGWRYDVDKNRFIISSYCYVGGKRMIEDICSLVYNHRYRMDLFIDGGNYHFKVTDVESFYVYGENVVSYRHKKRIGFPLGFYFGGNQKAPHDMNIKIKKL